MPSVIEQMRRYACVSGFHNGIRAEGRRYEGNPLVVAPVAFYRFLHSVKKRSAQMLAATFAGRHSADDFGSLFNHLLGVEGTLVAGHALHQHGC